jgi:misacylated tRNA(Ala) deacylase
MFLDCPDGPPYLAKEERPAMKEADPRMHSAEHILTGALVKMFHCGRPFTTHLERKKSKADYRFDRPLTDAEIREIELRVNEAIGGDLPVQETFLPRAEAGKLFDLARLPESAGDTVRIIRIGEYDACPCSGTHVRSTREIGQFRIVSTTYEEGALRVRFRLEGGLE